MIDITDKVKTGRDLLAIQAAIKAAVVNIGGLGVVESNGRRLLHTYDGDGVTVDFHPSTVPTIAAIIQGHTSVPDDPDPDVPLKQALLSAKAAKATAATALAAAATIAQMRTALVDYVAADQALDDAVIEWIRRRGRA